MSNPAGCALGWLLSSSGNAGMFEGAIGHVAQPTTNQAIVGRRNFESVLEKYGPEIHDESCAEAYGNRANQQFNFHGYLDVGCSCLPFRFRRTRLLAGHLQPGLGSRFT